MKVVWIIVAGLLLFGTLNGLRKGLIKSIFSMFALIAALVIAAYGVPYGAKFLKTTAVYDGLYSKIEESISVSIEDEAAEQISGQVEAINALPFPEEIKKGLIDNNNHQIYEALGIEQFTQYIANYICMLIINVLSYIIIFIVAYIVLKIVGLFLDGIAELPVISGLNRVGGLILGMINGIMAVWVMFIVITLFCTTDWGMEAFKQINDSQVLSYIYNHNLLLSIIKNIGAILFS